MKTALCLFTLIFAILGSAAEKPYFSYGEVHAMGGYPMVGIGIRTQKNIHAVDFSANTCPLNPPKSLIVFHLRALYLIYPAREGLYLGAGLGFLNEPETIKRSSGSFESALGYQWKNRIFLEGNAIVPFKKSDILPPIWPGLSLGFGF